ncbi:MAG: tRNA 2-selenouridine(34) synthase MnmH [Rhodobacteraceae bacterium]|nr:tRNA 2-selenouridine(34) synthase MnmH [Paracoccaceae bacterium]
MALTLTSLSDLARLPFDTLIDARSPAEYAEDHLPGAVSLPVLDDAERARVGTIYKQVSAFTARKVGAALVARNVARHLEGPLAGKDGAWRPLVYCWRGGQRSGSFATILSQVGWRTETLSGGYKAWRTLVVGRLQDAPVGTRVVVLDGNTGSAKTEILNMLPARGIQVIDLEGLANHRGSLFGHKSGGQPSQKRFESRLAMALDALDPSRPVVVEAESSKIGAIALPKQLWAAMRNAPRVRIVAPRAARAAYLARTYGDVTEDRARLEGIIDLMRPMQPRERIEAWLTLARTGAFEELAATLMEHHYDPRYERHRARAAGEAAADVLAESLSPAALDGLADRVAAAVARL